MDEIDRKLLDRLMRNGRATWADLASELDLTAPAVAYRVRRLEERGVIRQFAAWVDAGALSPVSAFATVALDRPDAHAAFREQVQHVAAVQECHRVAGGDHYLLKLRCRSSAELDELVAVTLPKMMGGGRVDTSVVLATVKDTPVLPVEAD